MTSTFDPRILELISSRICHDLVSPVGAISNGVELVQDLGEEAGEEAMQLIATSAQQASVRLKMFRLAYGAAGTDKNIGFKDIRDVFTDLIGNGHVKPEFDADIGIKFSMPPRGFFKTLLNLLILAEESARGAGKLEVRAMDANKGISISVVSANAAFRDGAEDALAGKTAIDDLDPRTVHPYVTGAFAKSFGLGLEWKASPDGGRLEFMLTH